MNEISYIELEYQPYSSSADDAKKKLDKSGKRRQSHKHESGLASPKRGKQGVKEGLNGFSLDFPPEELKVNIDRFDTLLDSPSLITQQTTASILDCLQEAVAEALKGPQKQLKKYLKRLNKTMQARPKGERHFGSFEANRAFAMSLRDQLLAVQLRLKCPQCGSPATLVCFKPQRVPVGVFRFDHSLDGKRVSHSTAKDLPRLASIPVGIDQRRIS